MYPSGYLIYPFQLTLQAPLPPLNQSSRCSPPGAWGAVSLCSWPSASATSAPPSAVMDWMVRGGSEAFAASWGYLGWRITGGSALAGTSLIAMQATPHARVWLSLWAVTWACNGVDPTPHLAAIAFALHPAVSPDGHREVADLLPKHSDCASKRFARAFPPARSSLWNVWTCFQIL